ncbi:MAG TPA: hypothetical protein VH085_08180 [Nocardioides sp.]|jgi:hypothetical protein|nr:hypothetical protein [Nocardioides sp.]
MTTHRQAAAVAAAGLTTMLLGACTSSATSSRAGSPPCCDDTPTVAPVVSHGKVHGTYRQNRKAAAAESAAVVGLVPVPPGSTRLTSPPKSWSGAPDITSGPSDATLTKTAWWTVPGNAGTIQKQLLSHHPPGLRRQDGVGGGSDGIRFLDYVQPTSPDPAAYLPVTLQVMWGPHQTQNGRLIVRADTFTAARARRDPRSSLSGRVASVEIRQVRALRNGHTRRVPEVRLTRRHDRAAIARLVKTVDGLDASIRPPFQPPCPFPGQPSPRVALTFHTGRHGAGVVTMRLADWCFGQVHTSRNGRPVWPTLDPGDLVATVDGLRIQPAS